MAVEQTRQRILPRYIEDEISEYMIRQKDNVPERIDFTMQGDQVVLLSSRPGQVIETYPVELDRPRRIDSPEVAGLADELVAFHAQFQAKRKRYRYVLCDGPALLPFLRPESKSQVSIQYMWQHVLWSGVKGFAVNVELKRIAITDMKHAEAIAAFRTSLEWNPQSRDIRYNLCQAMYVQASRLRERGTPAHDLASLYSDIVKEAVKVRAADPANPNLLRLLGYSYRALGDEPHAAGRAAKIACRGLNRNLAQSKGRPNLRVGFGCGFLAHLPDDDQTDVRSISSFGQEKGAATQ